VNSKQKSRFGERLLEWYDKNKRDLPWRRDAHDPYRVWISETLLQQTQVATVIPYYERFLARFPTVYELSSAPIDDVLKTWEGAGYYARARNLHRAAKDIVERFGGKIPQAVDELLTLPGIGRYTAGAVASIAFNQNAPIVDGNIIRVLCRYFNIANDAKKSETQKELWALSESLIPRGHAGDFNQSMMELGATVCTPRNPSCDGCPLKRTCAAKKLGVQEDRPVKGEKKKIPHHQIGVGVIWKNRKILIARRFDDAMLGGLWEFPGGKRERGESFEECVQREVKEELEIVVQVDDEFAQVEHAYSHFSITMHAFNCHYVSGRPQAIGCADWKWVKPKELQEYAFPQANRKIIAQLSIKE
jgi:A/G-specific adenine glycosylase